MSIPAVSVPFRMEVNRLMGNLSDISGSPAQQGLYNPQNEHDACGMGFVVNVKGVQSHSIVGQGLEVLQNIEHRCSHCLRDFGVVLKKYSGDRDGLGNGFFRQSYRLGVLFARRKVFSAKNLLVSLF